MNRTTLLFLALASCCTIGARSQPFTANATAAPPTNQNNFHIYLLMGQSNMAGRDTRTLASQVDNPRILALTADGKWVVARDPIFTKEGRIEPGAGPGIPFALEMVKTDPAITIGLVPCAVGGTPLRRWVKGGDLYGRALERAKLVTKTGIISGVLWHQGESDTGKSENAETYETRLGQMIKDFRQDLGVTNLPVVVGQIGDFLPVEKNPYADKVRAAIKHVPANMPNVGYADSTGLDDKGDKLHFSAESQKQMGLHFAQAMQQLHPAQP